MKKLKQAAFLAAMLILLTACGKAPAEAPVEAPVEEAAPAAEEVHTHTADTWERDFSEHWQICECGEIFNQAAHALGEDLFCTDCGSEVWDYGDGSGCVYNYSEYGDWTRMTDYDADGNVLFEQIFEIEYDAGGSKLLEKIYTDGVLTEDWEYGENSVPKKGTFYSDDGTWSVNEYDESGNCVHTVSYTAEDVIEAETFSEYMEDADGWFYESKYTVVFSDGERHVTERNEYGDQTSWSVYLADGTLDTAFISEHTYDENGNLLWEKTDYNGERVDETVYTYDEDGNLLLEELTSTDGSAYLCEYQVIEDDWVQCVREVLTDVDGTYIVREYDEYEEVISEIRYDAAGNEIPMETEETVG